MDEKVQAISSKCCNDVKIILRDPAASPSLQRNAKGHWRKHLNCDQPFRKNNPHLIEVEIDNAPRMFQLCADIITFNNGSSSTSFKTLPEMSAFSDVNQQLKFYGSHKSFPFDHFEFSS